MSVAADSRRSLARAGLGAIALFVAGVVGCGAATGMMAVIGLFGGVPGVMFGALIGTATLPFWVAACLSWEALSGPFCTGWGIATAEARSWRGRSSPEPRRP